MTALPARTRLGVFAVQARSDEVGAFRAALPSVSGRGPSDMSDVPLTFPICWLAREPVRGAVRAALCDRADDEAVLVHVEQNVSAFKALQLDVPYFLELHLTMASDNAPIKVDGLVRDSGDMTVCRVDGTFALVPCDRPESA